jgi:hypothetical protein
LVLKVSRQHLGLQMKVGLQRLVLKFDPLGAIEVEEPSQLEASPMQVVVAAELFVVSGSELVVRTSAGEGHRD